MAKVKLDIETDLTQVTTALAKGEQLIQESGIAVNKFGDDAKASYMEAWKEANKYNKELTVATAQTKKLDTESQKLGKSVSYVQQLKKEIKQYTSEAAKAGEGTKEWTENLAKAGKLKDELQDLNKAVNALNGNLGENFAKAAGESIGLVARGYEGLIATQNLLGVETENYEKALLKLQSVTAIANLAKEFSGIHDTITEIKLGFSPLINLYKKGNEGVKNFFKNFKDGKQDVEENTSLFDKAKDGITNFVKGGISGVKALWATIVANPLGVILTLIGGAITAVVLFKDKIKPLAAIFEFFSDVVNKAIEPLKRLAEALGLIADQSEQRALNTIKNTEAEVTAITKKYDREIKLAEAAERHTSNLERKKTEATRKRVEESIKALEYIKETEGKLNQEQVKQYKEFTEQLEDIDNERAVTLAKKQVELKKFYKEQQNAVRDAAIAGIKDDQTREESILKARFEDQKNILVKEVEDVFGSALGSEMAEAIAESKAVKTLEQDFQNDLLEIREKYAKKRLEEQKKQNEKLKGLQKEFADAFLDIVKKADAARLSQLSGEARIIAEKEFQLKEIELLKQNLIAKGQAEENFEAEIQKRKAKNFELTLDQEEQFNILQRQVFADATQKLIALEVQRQNDLAKVKSEAAKSKETTLTSRENTDISTVNAMARPQDVSEIDFEQQKQIAILNIQKDYAAQRVELKRASLAAEREEAIKGYNGELAIIGDGEDAETQAKRKGVLDRVELTEQQFIAQQDETQAAYQAELKGIDDQLSKLNAKKPFDFAKLFGLTADELSTLQGNIQQLTAELQNLSNAYFDSKNEIIDEEIEQNQKLIAEGDKNIDSLKSQLERERDLNEQGKANNFDRINEEIAFEEAKREENLANERKAKQEKAELAKQQLIIDSLVQGSNLVLAATQIYATVAKDPYTTAIASATVVAMLAAFAVQKAAAFAAIKKQENSFKDGVIDLKGPGTTSSDSIKANLSRGESVMTAKETKDNLSLFKGIRYKNKALIEEGVLELLANTGVILPKELPKQLSDSKNRLKSEQIKMVLNNDYQILKKEQEATNKKLDELILSNKSFYFKDHNGNLVHKNVNHTIITRKQ